MGTFHIGCLLVNPFHRRRQLRVPRMLVDTGSEYTWVSEKLLRTLGVAPEKKDVASRQVGLAIVRIGEHFTIDEVVFGRSGDLQILGARTLEGLNLRVDSRLKRLVAAGPLPAAGGGRPR